MKSICPWISYSSVGTMAHMVIRMEGIKDQNYVCASRVGLCDPMDYTVHEILQARILKWVTFPFSRGSLPTEPPGKPKNAGVGSLSLFQWIF